MSSTVKQCCLSLSRLIIALLTLAISGCSSAPVSTPTLAPSPTPTPMPKNFRLVGYVTDGEVIVSQIQFDKLTHINYAFLIPDADGTFADVTNPWKLREVVEQGHAHGVKVLISVGGWGYDKEFERLATDPQTRTAFVNALDQFAQKYALDGIDIDWEYPGPEVSSARNYTALMQELNAILAPQGKLLTSAVVADGSTGDGVWSEVFGLVDFLNVMAYDGPDTNHSSYRYAEEALDYWSGRGLPADKTVLGVPFYTRPQEVPYRKLVRDHAEAANTDEFDYFGSKVYYNGIPTLQEKTRLALRRASGLMIWALPYDTTDSTSLLSAIYQTAYGTGRP